MSSLGDKKLFVCLITALGLERAEHLQSEFSIVSSLNDMDIVLSGEVRRT